MIRLYDIKNTLSFPSEETSLGSGIPSHLHKGDVPCPSIPSHGFIHHTIGALNNAISTHTITDLNKRRNLLKDLSKGFSEIIIQAQTNKVESTK